MPSYLAPDVYVEEIDSGNKPIEGVSTSVTGMVGVTQRGPSSGLPQLVTSFNEFRQIYGSYFDFGPTFAGHNTLPFSVDGFFTNLGSLLCISRVLPPGASTASIASAGGMTTRPTQDTSLTALLSNLIGPATLRGIHVGTQVMLRMTKNGVVTDSAVLSASAVNRGTGVVTLSANLVSIFETTFTTIVTDVNGIDAAGKITVLASRRRCGHLLRLGAGPARRLRKSFCRPHSLSCAPARSKNMTAHNLIFAVLAVWRLTHLLTTEDGPFDIVARLRRLSGSSFFGKLLDCFYCLSLWVAAPFALLSQRAWQDRLLLWLALSGAAILLNRLADTIAPDRPVYFEAPPLNSAPETTKEQS